MAVPAAGYPLVLALALVSVRAAPPLLVVLTPAGHMRDGLPVLARHQNSGAIERLLLRGFSGRLLRLYAQQQEFLRQTTGRAPEPAYLLLSDRQGGFAEFGFYLEDERKADVGWVDLHRSSRVSGRFGAMDQIFPHELFHVIVRQLAGSSRESGGNQVHAIGVRTDPVTAFAEGIAEHVQVLSVDDPDAVPDTRTLAHDRAALARAERELDRYRRDMSARWLWIKPSQMRFLIWFSSSEQALRYHAVKANAYAREAPVPAPLLDARDKYPAYLLTNVLPGAQNARSKPAATLLSTEGVISHLMWRWVTDLEIQQRRPAESFYASFGTRAADVMPLENAYLKLFAALYHGKPSDAISLVRAYRETFPDEAGIVDRIVHDAMLGQTLDEPAEIWLANPAFQVGTSLFDQFRALPREHTFDANAATAFDWLTVPGVTRAQAERLTRDASYKDLDAVVAAAEGDPLLQERVRMMSRSMDDLRVRATQEEESLSVTVLLMPFLSRLAGVLLVTSIVAAWLARVAGARRWWTAGLVGAAASSIIILFAWLVTAPPWYPGLAPVVVLGSPLAIFRGLREHSWRAAVSAWRIWGASSLPAVLVSGLLW